MTHPYARYRPKRAAQRWLHGAPEYVVACYDNGGSVADRYAVIFGGSLWTPAYAEESERCGRDPYLTPALAMSEHPSHPDGMSLWGDAVPGPHLGRQIRWLDLPLQIRLHVQNLAEGRETELELLRAFA